MDEKDAPEVEEEVEAAIDALRSEDTGLPEDEDDEPIEGEDEPEEDKEDEPGETVEGIAKELGWRPKDSFKDDGKEFLSASDFIRKGNQLRANASKGLKETQKKLESMETVIMDIKNHFAKTTKAQAAKHKKQIEALSKKRIEAIEEGDPEKVDALEGEMAELYNAVEEPQPTKDAPNPEDVKLFSQWREENPWYSPTGRGGDMEKTLYADEEAAKLERYPDLSYARKLEIVTQKVDRKFSKEPATPQPIPTVESPRPGKAKKKYSARDLDPESKVVMRNLVRSGVMTQEEYLKDWAIQREA